MLNCSISLSCQDQTPDLGPIERGTVKGDRGTHQLGEWPERDSWKTMERLTLWDLLAPENYIKEYLPHY